MIDYSTETLFEDVKSLAPATVLELDLQTLQRTEPEKYWEPNNALQTDISFEDAASELRRLFLRSIELHLRSDVPVGSALSGGIDSSSIVSSIRQVGGPEIDIRTISYLPDAAEINEKKWIDVVVANSKSDASFVSFDSERLFGSLDELIRVQGEPFGSTSIFAQNLVFGKAADNGLKVMLDGQGADEMFAGYDPFYGAALSAMLRSLKAKQFIDLTRGINKNRGLRTATLAIARAGFSLAPQSVANIAFFAKGIGRSDWINKNWFEQQGMSTANSYRWGHEHSLHEALENSTHLTSLPMLLRFEDRNSMAHSIESRVPFLLPSIAEFAAQLPAKYLISKNGVTKYALREAMRGIVPAQVLDRRDKIGFQTPQFDLFSAHADWIDRLFQSDLAKDLGIFNVDAIRTQWRERQRKSGRGNSQVWRCINLIKWAETFKVGF